MEASTVDGHNWLFPVAFGVVEAESEESWVWFLQQLRNIIGTPPGLAIHTDASKGLESAVEIVFLGVEHRECMRHLARNFRNKFKCKVANSYKITVLSSTLTQGIINAHST